MEVPYTARDVAGKVGEAMVRRTSSPPFLPLSFFSLLLFFLFVFLREDIFIIITRNEHFFQLSSLSSLRKRIKIDGVTLRLRSTRSYASCYESSLLLRISFDSVSRVKKSSAIWSTTTIRDRVTVTNLFYVVVTATFSHSRPLSMGCECIVEFSERKSCGNRRAELQPTLVQTTGK